MYVRYITCLIDTGKQDGQKYVCMPQGKLTLNLLSYPLSNSENKV